MKKKNNEVVLYDFEDKMTSENILKISWFAIKAVIVLWLLYLGAERLNGMGKFDGRTAEEWYNNYDYAIECIQKAHEEVQNIKTTQDRDMAASNLYDCL